MKLTIRCKLLGNLKSPGSKPMIWRLATQTSLSGFVADCEDDDALILQLTGDEERIKSFIRPLPGELAPRFSLKGVKVIGREVHQDGEELPTGFKVLVPEDYPIPVVRPDFVPCNDCRIDVLDIHSRRYAYPFWACADSGPNYSTMLFSPGTRKNTVFSAFPPCRRCRSESARNDHHLAASPLLACKDCGPHVFLCGSDGEFLSDAKPISKIQLALAEGKIVAVQSMFGGFQIFADAGNRGTLRALRQRKNIPDRPITVMARSVSVIKKICQCSAAEEHLLRSAAAPVVLLQIKEEGRRLLPLDLIAPESSTLAVVLPGSLLFMLLFEHIGILNADARVPDYLVTISNNWDGVSAKNDIDDLIHALRGTADLFLCHDLKIPFDNPVSIVAVRDGAPQIHRRSRGYAPVPIHLPVGLSRKIAAFGVDEHATVALGVNSEIYPSQHIGDIVTPQGATRLSALMEHFINIFDTVPDAVACDSNKELFSTQAAENFAERYGLPVYHVDSAHAFALPGLIENKLDHALAIVFSDGKLGDDGTYWGAELLDVTPEKYTRLSTFQPVSLPGKYDAMRQPMRQLFARFIEGGIPISDELYQRYGVRSGDVDLWRDTIEGKVSEPCVKSHSAERLFDSVSAALQLAPKSTTYVGQSSVMLENAARSAIGGIQNIPQWMYGKFSFSSCVSLQRQLMIDWIPTFANFSDPKWLKTDDVPQLALAFHAKVADAIDCMADYGRLLTGCNKVLLAGNLFMNGILFDLTLGKLRGEKFDVYYQRDIPLDESSLAIGQAFYAGRAPLAP